MPLKKQLAGLKRFAEIVDTSSKDASRARKVSRSPKMQQEISADRRTALSKNFGTVRQAIAERDAVATRKAKTAKAAKSR
jgi:predicted RecB family nuclease